LELNKLSTFLIIISIIILLSVGIYLMFPNIFIYTFTSHAYNNPKTFMGTISFIWSSTMESGIVVQLMVIILILLSGFIMLFDRVNILSAISSICFLFHLKNEFSTLGVGDLLDEYNFRFILPFIPFYIISVSIFCAKNKNIFYKAIIFSIIFSLLFYLSGLYESFPPGRGGRPPELIRSAYGLHFILPQEGRILMEGTVGHIREFISDFDLNISLNQIDPIPPMFKYDSYYDTNAYALSNLGITRDFGEFDKYEKKYSNIDYSFYDEDLLNEYTKRLCAGEYSLVIIAPPTWFTINLIANKKCSPLDDYCTLYIPFYEYLGHGGRTYATLYLRDWGQCKVIKKDVYNYYKNNFDILCQESEYLANNLIDSIGPFAATMPKCNSGNDFLTRYKLGTSLVTLNDLLLFVFVFLLSLYYLRQRT